MTFKPKYNALRKDEKVMRWYRNLRQGSPITGDIYLRTFGLYCSLNKTTPKQITEDARTGKLRDKFIDFVDGEGKRGKAGSYTVKFKKVLNSWCLFNGYEPNLKQVRIQGANIAITVTEERPPQPQEINLILRNATTRGRAIISLMAFSGLRPESLGNYDGSDAVKIKDIEGIAVKPDGVDFSILPARLNVRQSKVQLSKKGHRYFTFIGEQEAKYLKDYLDMRIRSGENLNPESPIITKDTRGSSVRKSSILATAFLLRDVRDAVKHSGLKFRPYVLRVYFSSALDIAEAKGTVSHNWREFWFGHQGDMSARYSTNKVLPKDTIDEMRETFRKCIRYIETEEGAIKGNETEMKAKETMLLVAGFKRDEIEKENMLEMDAEELGKKVREKMLGAMANNGHNQKVIPRGELEHYIEELGWEWATNIDDGKVIVKLPEKFQQ